LLLLAGLQNIDASLYEAARIDGASAWRQFRFVTLPLLRPAILVALIFRTLDAFRVFDLIYALTGGGPGSSTEPIALYTFNALFTQRNFWVPIRNSLVVAGSTTALCVALGAFCAYALARLEFPGRTLLLGAVLAVGMFPQISVVSPLYLVLRRLHLINTYPGL